MAIKDINEIINTPLSTRERLEKTQKEMLDSTIRRSWFNKQPQRPDPNSTMKEVVPPLNRADMLKSWQDDRKELAKVRQERDKYRKIINTKFSKDWRSELNEEEKK